MTLFHPPPNFYMAQNLQLCILAYFLVAVTKYPTEATEVGKGSFQLTAPGSDAPRQISQGVRNLSFYPWEQIEKKGAVSTSMLVFSLPSPLLYSLVCPVQGMMPPTMCRSSHPNQQSQENSPYICPKSHLPGTCDFCQVDNSTLSVTEYKLSSS